jgi:N-glycosidase YbiA
MSQTNSVINFNRTNDPYGEFSNFALYPINIKGVVWPTSEHYFQSQKSEDPFIQKEILKAATPRIAADLGRAIN